MLRSPARVPLGEINHSNRSPLSNRSSPRIDKPENKAQKPAVYTVGGTNQLSLAGDSTRVIRAIRVSEDQENALNIVNFSFLQPEAGAPPRSQNVPAPAQEQEAVMGPAREDDEARTAGNAEATSATQGTQTQELGLHEIQRRILTQRLFNSQQQETTAGSEWQGRQFSCRQCVEKFSHQNLLSMHVQEAHPVLKPYPCPECSKAYMWPDVLEAHFAMYHRGEQPFPCDLCPKVFSRREYLQVHSRVHTGIRPYLCCHCARTFAWKSSLDVHVRTHTGEKPYVCVICLREFSTSGSLKMHQMIHTNSWPFPCARCTRRYRRRSDLRVHMELHSESVESPAAAEVEGEGDSSAPAPASPASSPLATPLLPSPAHEASHHVYAVL